MSKLYYKAMVVLCMTAFVGLFAGAAAAENVYLYDFDSLSDGNIIGQDNWADFDTVIGTWNVADGGTGWTGKLVTLADDGNGASAENAGRQNNLDWSYSLQNDQDFEFSAKLLVNGTGTNNSVYAALNLDGGTLGADCLYGCLSKGYFRWKLNVTADSLNELWGTGLGGGAQEVAFTANKIYLVGIAATANGSGSYDFQPFYENLTDGGGRVYVNDVRTRTITDLSTAWNGIHFYGKIPDSAGLALADEFKIIGQVPEPSTFALLAAGLIGLLAYAWRKRK